MPGRMHKGLSGRNVTSFGSNYPQSPMRALTERMSPASAKDSGWDLDAKTEARNLDGSCQTLARATMQLPYSEHSLRVADAVIYLSSAHLFALRCSNYICQDTLGKQNNIRLKTELNCISRHFKKDIWHSFLSYAHQVWFCLFHSSIPYSAHRYYEYTSLLSVAVMCAVCHDFLPEKKAERWAKKT